PEGCVNVHGHVHLKSTIDRCRINVCVEQIGYTLVPVTDVRELVARLNLAAARLDLAHTRGNTTTEHFIDWAKDLANVGAAGEGAAP
ncbi:MAG: hypothetical protein OXG35_08365, partial [Acidobacteria bacterium]|nr:hypothetical protein [Acidobacteriota bacterium]